MKYGGSFAGHPFLRRKVKAGGADSAAAGQVVITDTNYQGQAQDPTVSDAADVLGVTTEATNYSTTQADAEGAGQVWVNPFAFARSNIAGGSGGTEGTALTVSENDTASAGGTTLTEGGLPSDSMAGAFVYGLSGANGGQSRICATYTSATSLVVTVPFNNAIASGDTFLVIGPAPLIATKVELSTVFTEVNQYSSRTVGIDAAVVDLIIDDTDPSTPTAEMRLVFRDHYFNPLS